MVHKPPPVCRPSPTAGGNSGDTHRPPLNFFIIVARIRLSISSSLCSSTFRLLSACWWSRVYVPSFSTCGKIPYPAQQAIGNPRVPWLLLPISSTASPEIFCTQYTGRRRMILFRTAEENISSLDLMANLESKGAVSNPLRGSGPNQGSERGSGWSECPALGPLSIMISISVIFHGSVEVFFHYCTEPVNLINEQNILWPQAGK